MIVASATLSFTSNLYQIPSSRSAAFGSGLGGAACPRAARIPRVAADRLGALGSETLRERLLRLLAERQLRAEQPLERRQPREVCRWLGETGTFARDRLKQRVVAAIVALLFELAAHRLERQRVCALGIAGCLDIEST